MARILLIDDDADFAETLRGRLDEQDHEVRWLDLAEDGLKLLASAEPFDLVLLDNKMPRMSGLEFLSALAQSDLAVPVVLMTGAHNDRTVMEAMDRGAAAYAVKPDDGDFSDLLGVLHDELRANRRPRPVHIPEPDQDGDDSIIVGRSKAILKVLMQAARCARMDETVLILGETGTGKDLVAQAIHTNSRRKSRPFVVMNCTALSEGLLDDELFGHEPGAFTGADKLRKGRFEHAHGGTLFLDEVGDMPLPLQAKLLRVLQNREVVRIGSNDPIKVDVRVLAATHRDLKTLVREGAFRQDLFYRLEGITLLLPPLRERTGDVGLLARRFLKGIFEGGTPPALHPEALQLLRNHPWPGNVRQLQKVMCRAAAACRGAQIMPEDLGFGDPEGAARGGSGAADGLHDLLEVAWKSDQPKLWPFLREQLEVALLRFALAQPGLSQVKLAERLGVSRNYLRDCIEKYGLQSSAAEA